ncbi:PdaC/SigV domain-containing protein [Qipengyuania sediminis]|uniref:PdaC/SigV domain-containing protein n=1 Tax=Qipengyuania sediminis TaxID=1532023 RepID=UPI0010593CD1|nr:DUF4163 domain-containing protein [Qipengyuania sediminis]
MRLILFPISLLLSSAACSSEADYAEAAGLSAASRSTTAARPRPEPVSFTSDDARKDALREFDYKWPAEVSAEPALAAMLATSRDRLLAQEQQEFAAALTDAPADCAPCRNRSYAMEWKVVADTPRFLSLSGEFATYTGGAHGMYGLTSLIWDRSRQQAMTGWAMFSSPEALQTALGPRLCAALNGERAKKRGESVPPPSADDTGFNACSSVAEATVLIGSRTGRAFDRIGIWYGPYVAGPYAEGPYELDFPVDAAVLRAVKPEYRGAFAAGR